MTTVTAKVHVAFLWQFGPFDKCYQNKIIFCEQKKAFRVKGIEYGKDLLYDISKLIACLLDIKKSQYSIKRGYIGLKRTKFKTKRLLTEGFIMTTKMKKRISSFALTGVLALRTVVPVFAASVNVDGGVWDYGTSIVEINQKKVYSNYLHNT
ncbi:MAG: hypothetical protein ACFWTN_04245 [Clostridium sp.]